MSVYGTACRLAEQITKGNTGLFSKADLAELRRLNPDAPANIAFWRVFHREIHAEGAPSSPLSEQNWMVLLSGMAHHALHDPKTPVGQALQKAGYSEQRLVRLLEAREEPLQDQIRQAARYLSAKAQPINWGELAALLFFPDPKLRHRVARDYFQQEYSAQKEKKS